MNLQSIRQSFNEKRGEQKKIKRDLEASLEAKTKIEREISVSEKALMIITAVAQATQQELQYRIEEPVSLALNAVYPEDPYKFVADFQITNAGPIQCHLGFERNGYVCKPTESSGGGPIDIASFALRIGALSLEKPQRRLIIILDEPFKWLDIGKMSYAADLLETLSKKLNIQFIILTHLPGLIERANKIIWVAKKDRESCVEFENDFPSFVKYLKEKQKTMIRPNKYHKELFNYFLREK